MFTVEAGDIYVLVPCNVKDWEGSGRGPIKGIIDIHLMDSAEQRNSNQTVVRIVSKTRFELAIS